MSKVKKKGGGNRETDSRKYKIISLSNRYKNFFLNNREKNGSDSYNS